MIIFKKIYLKIYRMYNYIKFTKLHIQNALLEKEEKKMAVPHEISLFFAYIRLLKN